tara:strand:+ start:9541 stop:10983 length:1443 start_codon:yes stop_codon:yes gene_type:complete
MEHMRKSIMQVLSVCTEKNPQIPDRIVTTEEYSGTCFRVDPSLFPFGDKILFLTNFHVCDNSDRRQVYLRTAAMGKSALSGFVEAVVPQLDCAVISISSYHDRWFIDETPASWISHIRIAPLSHTRIDTKSLKVSTVGFPQGLEEQLSSGWLAGRGNGSDDMDMLQLNISINSGNSGGPVFDPSGDVIGICTSTLNESEAIAFAVPIYSVLAYFQKFYIEPFGRFPEWGLTLIPMTDAHAIEHGVAREGAVVAHIADGSAAKKVLKKGDVLHSITSGDFHANLDSFGLISDNTRGSKITMHNTELILQLTPGDVQLHLTRRRSARVLPCTPSVINYKVVENYSAWNPVDYMHFGPLVLQTLSKTLLMTEDCVPTAATVFILQRLRQTGCMKEMVIISHVAPGSYVSNMEVPLEFALVQKIGRTNVKNMKHCRALLDDVAQRWRTGLQQRVCLGTNAGDVWLTIDNMLGTAIRKRKHTCTL